MTADATLPASDDLTPEVLARVEARASTPAKHWRSTRPGDIVCVQTREDMRALLSEVRSRDARIAELEGVIEEAPHSKFCTSKHSAFTATELERPCDCWKSRYRSGVRHE